jgi:hypothetical protein
MCLTIATNIALYRFFENDLKGFTGFIGNQVLKHVNFVNPVKFIWIVRNDNGQKYGFNSK